MDKRREELNELRTYTEGIDNELTMILQSLQWERKELLQKPAMVTCRYDPNHKIPPDKTEEHEKECFLRLNGYTKDHQLLPDPHDPESSTLVKLSKEDIQNIIGNAAKSDPVFKRVNRITVQGFELQQLSDIGCHGAEPMSLERLQQVYSADERRAIHDAVVSAVPSCHDLTDLALLSGEDKGTKKILSRMEILLELRNMRRRRTKYRVAAKSRNYSDVLRDVIKTQMEHYTEGKSDQSQNESTHHPNNQKDHQSESSNSRHVSKDDDKYRNEQYRKVVPRPMVKIERDDSTERDRDYYSRERTERRRDKHDRHPDRYRLDDRSRERALDEDLKRSHRSQDEYRKRKHYRDSDKHSYEKSKEQRKGYESDTEYNHEKRSRKSHKHRDFYQVKEEPGYEEERHYYNREKERRHDDKRDKTYKQKDRTERNYEDDQYTDRGRSSERQDKRYEGRYKEKMYIKQEKDESTSRNNSSRHSKNESRERRRDEGRYYDTSYRDASSDSYSSQRSHKQDQYRRFYDQPKEEFNPNKKIKIEK